MDFNLTSPIPVPSLTSNVPSSRGVASSLMTEYVFFFPSVDLRTTPPIPMPSVPSVPSVPSLPSLPFFPSSPLSPFGPRGIPKEKLMVFDSLFHSTVAVASLPALRVSAVAVALSTVVPPPPTILIVIRDFFVPISEESFMTSVFTSTFSSTPTISTSPAIGTLSLVFPIMVFSPLPCVNVSLSLR